jgi:hypothetical protein
MYFVKIRHVVRLLSFEAYKQIRRLLCDTEPVTTKQTWLRGKLTLFYFVRCWETVLK